jgi:hypothetical protein
MRLFLHILSYVVRELAPFYGGDCPIAVVYGNYRPDNWIVRTSLGGYRRRKHGPPRSAIRADIGRLIQGPAQRVRCHFTRIGVPPSAVLPVADD